MVQESIFDRLDIVDDESEESELNEPNISVDEDGAYHATYSDDRHCSIIVDWSGAYETDTGTKYEFVFSELGIVVGNVSEIWDGYYIENDGNVVDFCARARYEGSELSGIEYSRCVFDSFPFLI
jgi:hypothetical protein